MKKRMLALLLSLSLCVSLLPAVLAEGETALTYDQAVAELRSRTGHSNEQTIETDDCTIFIFDRDGFMNAPKGMMVLIYKPGSQPGEGTTIELPHARTQGLNVVTPADTMELSADQKTFTYTYRVKEPIKVGDQVVQEAGIYTYVADLPTGEVTESHTPLSTDGTYLISITTADGVVTSGYRTEWRWVALSRSDPGCPGILLRGEDCDVTGSLRRSDGLTVGDDLDAWGKAQDGKPSTLTLGRESWECTARYKDYGDQSVLYVEFPPYEVGVSHQPDHETIWLFRYDWAQKDAKTYDQAVAELQGEDGYATEETFESDYGTIFLYNNGPDPHAQHGFLTFITKAPCAKGEGKTIALPQPRDGLFCLVKPPHAMALSEDGKTFTYSYHYDDPVLSGWDEFLRSAGDYHYTLDLTTGKITEKYTPLGYEKTLAQLTRDTEYTKTDRVVEGLTATAVLWYRDNVVAEYNTEAYRDYMLYLVFKDDNAPEAFCRLILPSTRYLTAGGWAPTDRAPDSMAFSEDGKSLTYVYSFDSPLAEGETVYHEAGTYTYTVDAATGELTISHSDGAETPTQPEAPSAHGFTDVASTDWFAPYVELVTEKGVMIGTGETTFSPQAKLTRAECLTLAFRLYDLLRGQEHVIEKAPEAEGKITLTLADGTTFEGYASGDHRSTFSYWSGNGRNAHGLCVDVPGWNPWSEESAKANGPSQMEWLDAHPDVHGSDCPATLTLNGVTYQGTTHCWIPAGPYVFMFCPEPEKAEDVNSILRQAVYQGANPELWWWDTAYTISQRGLKNIFNPAYFTDDPASRGFFARFIAAACEGHLEKLNTVGAIPDLSREKSNTSADAYREAVYQLYGAGILTGVDEEGTFSADATLTRAEAAAMVARAIDKSQRVTVPPKDTSAYDKAVFALRESSGYRDEVIYESELCSVFSYGIGGTPHGYYAMLKLIYKAGSPLGEGTEVSLPLIEKANGWRIPLSPDVIFLNEDRSVLTYLYHLEENNSAQLPRGEYRYTVDLASGEVSTAYLPD